MDKIKIQTHYGQSTEDDDGGKKKKKKMHFCAAIKRELSILTLICITFQVLQ